MKTTIKPLYFTSKTCGVCKVLKPKLLEAVQENFPEVKIRVVEVGIGENWLEAHSLQFINIV